MKTSSARPDRPANSLSLWKEIEIASFRVSCENSTSPCERWGAPLEQQLPTYSLNDAGNETFFNRYEDAEVIESRVVLDIV